MNQYGNVRAVGAPTHSGFKSTRWAYISPSNNCLEKEKLDLLSFSFSIKNINKDIKINNLYALTY